MKRETACAVCLYSCRIPASQSLLLFFFSFFASLFGVPGSATPEVARFPSAPLGSVAFLPRAALSKDLLGLLPTAHSQQPHPLATSPPATQALVMGLILVSDCPCGLPEEARPCGSLEESLMLGKEHGGDLNEEQMRTI